MQRELSLTAASLDAGAVGSPETILDAVPPLRTRIRTAALTVLVWAVSLVPTLFGVQRCAIATLFHVPCPGCGMTRALLLLAQGDTAGSFRMHPLALPVLVAGGMLILSSVWTALSLGTPVFIHRSRFGRAAIALAVVVYAVATALWALRWLGPFGGPVSVY